MAWELEHEIIWAGYKQLAKRYHPDKGGTADRMVKLNAARDMLKALVAGAQDSPLDTPEASRAHAVHYQTPRPYQPMTPADFLQYVRREMNKDPLSAGLLTIIDNFVARKAGRRKAARS